MGPQPPHTNTHPPPIMPAIMERAANLLPRYVCNGYYDNCYNSAWNSWARWLVLALIIVGAFFIFFLFSCSRRVITGRTRTTTAGRTMSSCSSLRMSTSHRRVRHQQGDRKGQSTGLCFQYGLNGHG